MKFSRTLGVSGSRRSVRVVSFAFWSTRTRVNSYPSQLVSILVNSYICTYCRKQTTAASTQNVQIQNSYQTDENTYRTRKCTCKHASTRMTVLNAPNYLRVHMLHKIRPPPPYHHHHHHLTTILPITKTCPYDIQ